jgi:hypothetical protein
MALAALLLFSGCAGQRFLLYKDGQAYYFGSAQEGIKKLLCDSGDLERVLQRAQGLSQDTKEALWHYNCVELSGEKLREILQALSPAQRRQLREAFQAEGYDINYIAC